MSKEETIVLLSEMGLLYGTELDSPNQIVDSFTLLFGPDGPTMETFSGEIYSNATIIGGDIYFFRDWQEGHNKVRLLFRRCASKNLFSVEDRVNREMDPFDRWEQLSGFTLRKEETTQVEAVVKYFVCINRVTSPPLMIAVPHSFQKSK
jgi:hypothetical protein